MKRSLRLDDIHDLACRFVPAVAADRRLYESGVGVWWPAHEIGHFLVATAAECHEVLFGLETPTSTEVRYAIIREVAATSISQRLLRRSGHADLADEEIGCTDEDTLACAFESWCKRAVRRLLHAHKLVRLPTTRCGLEILLARKARQAETPTYPSHQAAVVHRRLCLAGLASSYEVAQ